MAEAGATVVVNDLGVDVSGEGADEPPARKPVERSRAAGSTATGPVRRAGEPDVADRADADDRGPLGNGEVDEAALGPHHTTAVPVFPASEAAAGVTGCTLAIAGDDVAVVSDLERERTLSAEGRKGARPPNWPIGGRN